MSAVPLIDIAPFLHGDAAARQRVAAEVDRACREIGFLMVTGHGVPPALAADFQRELEDFFTRSVAGKQPIGVSRDSNRGWRGPDATALARSMGQDTPPDLMERYTMGRYAIPDDDYHRSRALTQFQPNRWPEDAPALRPAGEAYYAAMERLAGQLMALCAAALGLPEGWFAPFIGRHISHLVANFYPEVTAAPREGQLRAGEHTDFGALTILNPVRSPRGLQVHIQGAWQDVAHVPGSFVINIGDLMALWTNDRWVSTLHRVLPPADAGQRLSLAFFLQPDEDALIRCIPTCTDAAHPPKYTPVTSGEHHRGKSRAVWLGREQLADALVK